MTLVRISPDFWIKLKYFDKVFEVFITSFLTEISKIFKRKIWNFRKNKFRVEFWLKFDSSFWEKILDFFKVPLTNLCFLIILESSVNLPKPQKMRSIHPSIPNTPIQQNYPRSYSTRKPWQFLFLTYIVICIWITRDDTSIWWIIFLLLINLKIKLHDVSFCSLNNNDDVDDDV